MKVQVKIFSSIFAILLASAVPLMANEGMHKGKCMEEAKKLCPNLSKGNGLGKCIREHKAEFSKECQEKGAEKKAKLKNAMKDCKQDVKSLCADVERGEGRIVKCLKENSAKLSVACKAHIDKAPMK